MTTTLRHQRPARRAAPRRQQGVVMFVALIVLVLMTLAGLAMLRQLGTGVSIAGNVAFKQSATNAADVGTEAGFAWLIANHMFLNNSAASAGYVSSWGASVDPNAFNWSNAPVITDAATGNVVKYVIHRLCELPNVGSEVAGQHCSTKPGQPVDKSGTAGPPLSADPYYRITTQVAGPRNTLSYIQVVVSLYK